MEYLWKFGVIDGLILMFVVLGFDCIMDFGFVFLVLVFKGEVVDLMFVFVFG